MELVATGYIQNSFLTLFESITKRPLFFPLFKTTEKPGAKILEYYHYRIMRNAADVLSKMAGGNPQGRHVKSTCTE